MTRSVTSMDANRVIDWLWRLAKVIEENKEELTRLDAAVGDADHGINMDRGFKKVVAKLPDLRGKEIGSIFRETALVLISSVGGASGPLYGTFFLKAAEHTAGKSEVTAADLGEAMRKGLSGLAERGKAMRGQKTMIDALEPAIEAFEKAVQEGCGLRDAMRLAEASAEQGMKDTISMVARKGRASYLGERSVGHQDPGATSAFFLIRTLREELD